MMTLRFALLTAATASITLLTACPLAPTCGGYNGAGDVAYARPNGDSAIACSNGGFLATLGATAMEGRLSGSSVTDGATGALAFDFTQDYSESGVQTAHSTSIGSDWTAVDMNEVALDHADTLCADLATRAWWTSASTSALPVATAFGKPAEGYGSVEECTVANPTGTVCEDVMLLCPDGTAHLQTSFGKDGGRYTAEAGELSVVTGNWDITGTYLNATGVVTAGALDTFALTPGSNATVHWQTKALADVSLSCQ